MVIYPAFVWMSSVLEKSLCVKEAQLVLFIESVFLYLAEVSLPIAF